MAPHLDTPAHRWNVAPALMLRLQALAGEDGAEELREALDGFERYRAHPFRRARLRPPVIWRAGSSAVQDHGGAGPPVLFVPSLINGSMILDLAEGHSCIARSRAAGHRSFLLDWGTPTQEEATFRVGDYVTRRLFPAIEAVQRASGQQQVALIGYCMGGIMALVAAAQKPSSISHVVTLGAPWDFSQLGVPGLPPTAELEGLLIMLGATTGGVVPPQIVQSFFAQRDPSAASRKFSRFGGEAVAAEDEPLFVAIEDWLYSGAPLTVAAARECLSEWYGANGLLNGTWRDGAAAFRADAVKAPCFVLAGAQDRVVPLESALPLADALPSGTLGRFDTGHLGLVIGSAAEQEIWPKLLHFLSQGATSS